MNTDVLTVMPSRVARNGDARPLVLTEKESAVELGLSTRTLQAMRVNGNGPRFIKLTERRIGYALVDLQAWLASRSVASTSAATVSKARGGQA